MNKSMLIGRATRDPEVRYSQGENSMAIARVTMAVDRKFKRDGEQTADFINLLAFGKIAELIEKYISQGNKFGVVGHIQTGNYTNKEGQKVYTTEVVIDELDFLESRKDGESSNQGGGRPSPSQAVGDGFMNIPDGLDEELPFN
ncbi:single-stranded DNA-binding protein [Anaerosporobacter sp.]|uniref:single-stranded DNA-binding protein n=1 Tax=Anaerosporobacter sp. TaxID=1872529 RepID=UPI00286F2015|nr:single-stranded DNA-binding protein [Anaerosporobacter sp.]